MIQEKKYAARRVRNVAFMVLALVLLTTCYKAAFHLGIDILVTDFFLLCLFFMIFVFVLAYHRIHGLIHENMSETHTELMITFIISVLIMFAAAFLPEFAAPALIISVFLSLVSNAEIGMILAFFLNIIYSINVRQDFYELACYLTLAICGCILMRAFQEKKTRFSVNMLVFTISILTPCLFYYFKNRTMVPSVFINGLIAGLISDLLLLCLFDRIYHITVDKEERSLEEIIAENYPLVQEIRKFSTKGYNHALKVSSLSYKCAKAAGANAGVAAAAGFYYRLGKLEGEPVIENGVGLAQLNCFPQAVIDILQEYNGELRLPGTPESAIVNMVDVLVSRFEYVQEETKSSNWNREILIYQTMNDKSSSGLYDKSGLSINQYNKIKEFLVRGDDLQ